MGAVWDTLIHVLWIVTDFWAIILHFLLAILFSLLGKICGNNMINFVNISKTFFDLGNFNTMPLWTTAKENKKKLRNHDTFATFVYIFCVGIWSFLCHFLESIFFGFLCMFIIFMPITLPFCKCHFKLAFVELNPFKYDILVQNKLINDDDKKKRSHRHYSSTSSAYSSAISSRESSPVPN